VKNVELRVQTWRLRANGPGFAFDDAPQQWSCEKDEVKVLQALLNREFPESGQYELASQEQAVPALVAGIQAGIVDPGVLQRLIVALCRRPDLATAVADMDDAGLFAGLIERTRQRAGLRQWREVVENPNSTENDIQKVMQQHWWVFGGRYVSAAARRNLVLRDQVDLALIRADGALHIVEIKRANLPDLIVKHRSHYRVGDEVHQAVSQAINYLRGLDEHQASIQADLGIDSRRAFATVVLGHPAFVRGGLAPPLVSETIRTHNSHLSRVEVMTYADLLDGAQRSFALSEGDAVVPAQRTHVAEAPFVSQVPSD
jgi:hypothetical protein